MWPLEDDSGLECCGDAGSPLCVSVLLFFYFCRSLFSISSPKGSSKYINEGPIVKYKDWVGDVHKKIQASNRGFWRSRDRATVTEEVDINP